MQSKIDSKQQNIVEMFNDIAPKYDITNRVISGGTDIGWRRLGCEYTIDLLKKSSVRVLDLATGTGDMLLFWQEAAKKLSVKIESMHGIDPAEKMLDIAKPKIEGAKFSDEDKQKLLEALTKNRRTGSFLNDLVTGYEEIKEQQEEDKDATPKR